MKPRSIFHSANSLHGVDAICSNGKDLLCATLSCLTGDTWDGEVRLFRVVEEDGTLTTETALHMTCGVSCCSWLHTDGEAVFIGGDDGDARIISRNTTLESKFFSEQGVFGGHDDIVSTVSCDSTMGITGSWDGAVNLWDMTANGQVIAVLRDTSPTRIKCSAISANDNMVVAGDSLGQVFKWDLRMKELVSQIQLRGNSGTGACTSMALHQSTDSPNGEILVGTSFGSLFVLNSLDFSIVAEETKRHHDAIGALAVSTRGDVLTGGDDRIVYGYGEHYKDFVRAAAFCSTPRQAPGPIPVTGCWDGSITVWTSLS